MINRTLPVVRRAVLISRPRSPSRKLDLCLTLAASLVLTLACGSEAANNAWDPGQGEGNSPTDGAPAETGSGSADQPINPDPNDTSSPPGNENEQSPGTAPQTPDDPTASPNPSNDTNNNTPSGSTSCDAADPAVQTGVSRLRRLTRDAYNHTLRDLLGVNTAPADAIEPDESIGPFSSNATTPLTDLIVEQYQSVANEVASQVNPSTIAGCDVGTAACMDTFISEFGLKLYRRPLSTSESDAYASLFALSSERDGAEAGFRTVLATMLQSPHFLYHIEVGQAGAPSIAPTPLNAFELASRLSFFLWNSTPDDELLSLASDGSLLESTTLSDQVERMLTHDKARAAIALFHERLLGVQNVLGATKDPAEFPNFSPSLARAMLQETHDFADYVVRQGDGKLTTLLTASSSLLTEPLFDLYGATPPMGWTPGTPVELDPTQRAGLLTQAAFLTMHAHADQTSPVHRGILVRENLLCQILPSPPADVNNVAPSPTPSTTTRERLEQHVADPSCAGCHVLIDPIGLGFENYDPIGAYRTYDGPREVDAVGEVNGAGDDVAGTFDGAVELSSKLAQSAQVKECVTKQWFRFATGRMESNDDACTLQRLQESFKASDGNVRQLIVDLVTSDAFTYVRTLGTQDELTQEQL